eukprot:630140_1
MVISVHHQHQPLRQLRSRPDKKMTLTATDQFWGSPALEVEDAATTTIEDASSTGESAIASTTATDDDDDDDDDFMEVIILPPAHHELLSSDLPTVEDLKGYDHRIVDGLTDADGYASDDASSLFPQRKKRQQQQSRASWLLGLAVDPILPGLVRVPSTASLSEDEDSTTSDDSDDDDSSLPSSSTAKRSRGGVSFNDNVKVQPIPHSSALSFNQRRKMYSTSVEVRLNKT